jgi:hypothetical protein
VRGSSPATAVPEDRLRVGPVDGTFDATELEDLPEPVKRYLRAAIAPGAALSRAADIRMRGHLKLNGRWLRLRARETLAPLDGFVWRARVAGVISGSDRAAHGGGVLDWRLFGLVRVAHDEGPDIGRSGAGRAAGEAVWLPTVLLPRFGVRWEAESDHDLTALLPAGGHPVVLRLRVRDDGRLDRVVVDRWGDPDGSGTWGLHPFGFRASAWHTFGPLSIPAAGAAGWLHGTHRWTENEFFRCTITSLTPVPAPGR